MNNNKAEAEERLNVGLQEAVTTGQIVVQVTDDSDPPQPIAGAQVTVIDGTIVTGTTNADGEVTLDVSFGGMELFATKDVTVTVTPPDGYTLSERSTQTVTAIAVATIDVNLVLEPFSLGSRTLQVVRAGPGSGTVSSVPTGISCGEDCREVYPNGTAVTLTATPVADSVFSGWSGGGCSGTGPCTVTMDQNRTIIANFGFEVHTLQIVLAGPGSGTVSSAPAGISCGEDCSDYPNGTQVTLTATPETDSVFSGWSGSGCSESNPQCILTMDRDHTVTATFTLQQFVLQVTLAGNGSGTVTFNPPGITCGADCSEEYSSGTQVTLTPMATPETSTFTGWSGGGCSGREPCVVQMDQDRFVTANFTLREPPTISNIQQSGTTTNFDSCVRSDGSTFAGGRYFITFDYNDPDGDASNSQGATVQAFDSFDATPFSSFSGDGFTGSIQSNLCSVFGNAPSVNVTVTLTDGNGLVSNELTITISAPDPVIE